MVKPVLTPSPPHTLKFSGIHCNYCAESYIEGGELPHALCCHHCKATWWESNNVFARNREPVLEGFVTLTQLVELIGVSRQTVGRYTKQGLFNPRKVKMIGCTLNLYPIEQVRAYYDQQEVKAHTPPAEMPGLSAAEVGAVLFCSPANVYRLMWAGKLKAHAVAGKHRFYAEDVKAYQETRKEEQ
jgi:predicted DNA-binding transcriptional regulator AlpA